MTTVDLHRLTGAYALHALPDEESTAFERHLAGCEPCAEETAELSATAARLGLAVASTPPTALREQVLRRITAVRQETPGRQVRSRTARVGPRTRARPAPEHRRDPSDEPRGRHGDPRRGPHR